MAHEEHDYAKYAEMDLGQTGEARNNQTQTRPMGLFKKSSDFDGIEEINPFTQMESNPKGTRVHRLVQKLKGKPGIRNPYAVAQAQTGQSYATGKKL